MTLSILFFAVVGICLVIVEMFLPGLVFGAMALLSMLVAVILTFVQFGTGPAIAMLAGLLIAAGVVAAACFKSLPKGIGSRPTPSDSSIAADLQGLQDREGRSLSMLKPAGKAEFDGRLVDVTAETGIIQAGRKIRVVQVLGTHLIVRQV